VNEQNKRIKNMAKRALNEDLSGYTEELKSIWYLPVDNTFKVRTLSSITSDFTDGPLSTEDLKTLNNLVDLISNSITELQPLALIAFSPKNPRVSFGLIIHGKNSVSIRMGLLVEEECYFSIGAESTYIKSEEVEKANISNVINFGLVEMALIEDCGKAIEGIVNPALVNLVYKEFLNIYYRGNNSSLFVGGSNEPIKVEHYTEASDGYDIKTTLHIDLSREVYQPHSVGF
jgi:hypothetical protein